MPPPEKKQPDPIMPPEEIEQPPTSEFTLPDVVGLTGEQALKNIQAAVPPSWSVWIIAPGDTIIADHRENRVKIFVDEAGIVRDTPSVG
ncbi:unnamed protein product [Closterium sp. Naga37s-1]|nr:unnamed protein product [Closterium sp. Naga37s-1]